MIRYIFVFFGAKPVASEVRVQEMLALPKNSQKRLHLSEMLSSDISPSFLRQGTGHIVVGCRCDKVRQRAYEYTACSF